MNAVRVGSSLEPSRNAKMRFMVTESSTLGQKTGQWGVEGGSYIYIEGKNFPPLRNEKYPGICHYKLVCLDLVHKSEIAWEKHNTNLCRRVIIFGAKILCLYSVWLFLWVTEEPLKER